MEKPFFLRQKEVRIVRLADDRYRLDGEMRDDFHVIRASLTIERIHRGFTKVAADSCWVFNTANDERFEKQWREQP